MFKGIHIEYVENYNRMKREEYELSGSIQDVSYWYVHTESHTQWHSSLNQEESLSRQVEMLTSLPTKNMVVVVKLGGNVCRICLYLTPAGLVVASRTALGDKFNIERKREETISRVGISLSCYIVDMLNSKGTLIGNVDVKNNTLSGRDKIIPITYISTKKTLAESKKLHPQVVDWKHSWEVLGHWRTVKCIGKDRDGNYGVFGKTWVNPCIKGDGELIKKLRIVK